MAASQGVLGLLPQHPECFLDLSLPVHDPVYPERVSKAAPAHIAPLRIRVIQAISEPRPVQGAGAAPQAFRAGHGLFPLSMAARLRSAVSHGRVMFTCEHDSCQYSSVWTLGGCWRRRFSVSGGKPGSRRRRWRGDWGLAVRPSPVWKARAKTLPFGRWPSCVARSAVNRETCSGQMKVACDCRPGTGAPEADGGLALSL